MDEPSSINAYVSNRLPLLCKVIGMMRNVVDENGYPDITLDDIIPDSVCLVLCHTRSDHSSSFNHSLNMTMFETGFLAYSIFVVTGS